LKVVTAAESVTKDGSAFQTRASATGKARSLIVVLREGGTTSADVDVELNRLLATTLILMAGFQDILD